MSPLEVVTFYQLTVETFKGDAKVIKKENPKVYKTQIMVNFEYFRIGESINTFVVKDDITYIIFTDGCKVQGR